jgi:hypothetical protein
MHEPQSYAQAIESEDRKQWEQAMDREYKSILQNDVWELVKLPPGRKVVGSRWVYKIKQGGLYKARFVVKGYSQRPGFDYDETFAPVARFASVRTVLSIAAGRSMHVHQMDVDTAFQLSKLKEEIYIQQPEGYVVPGMEDHVLRLNKSLYGLKQSALVWFNYITSVLQTLGFQKCQSDYGIFVRFTNGKPMYIVLYVDDLLIASEDEQEVAALKCELAKRFEMKDLGPVKRFLGIQVERGMFNGRLGMKLQQADYIRTVLERHGMENCNPVSTPLDSSVKLTKTMPETDKSVDQMEYQQLIGEISFAAIATRPDVAFAASHLAQFNCDPCQRHMAAAKRVLRYLKGTMSLGIVYYQQKVSSARPHAVYSDEVGYSDADWAGDVDSRRSTTGYVVLLNGGPIAC